MVVKIVEVKAVCLALIVLASLTAGVVLVGLRWLPDDATDEALVAVSDATPAGEPSADDISLEDMLLDCEPVEIVAVADMSLEGVVVESVAVRDMGIGAEPVPSQPENETPHPLLLAETFGEALEDGRVVVVRVAARFELHCT